MLQFLKQSKLCTKLVPETLCTLSIHVKIYLRSFANHYHLENYSLQLEHHIKLLIHL